MFHMADGSTAVDFRKAKTDVWLEKAAKFTG
jgi:hypothetical protein